MSYQHQSVLLKEVVELLNPRPNQNFIDCTLGGGGHAQAILELIGPTGKLLGVDLDKTAIEHNKDELKNFSDRLILVQDNFKNLNKIKNECLASDTISGILADLGLSSNQLQDGANRGFSFQTDELLDMRLDASQLLTAETIVNGYSEEQLFGIFQNYGQERLARLIARKIIAVRRKSKIKNSGELTELILEVYREKLKSKKEVPWIGGLHPATKVFQALRIAVNNELENLKFFLEQAVKILPVGGRLAVISFHSLEDKIVKQFFKTQVKDYQSLKIITKKAVQSSFAEKKANPRSRSAKLRVVEKL